MKYIHYVDFLSKTKIIFFLTKIKNSGLRVWSRAGGDENLIINFYWPKGWIKICRS